MSQDSARTALVASLVLYAASNTNVIVVITNVFEFAGSITSVNSFGFRLRQARQLRQLTQAQLARACGLSQGAIGNYEADSRRTAKDVFRIAEALNVEPAWLAMGTGPMEPQPRPTLADATRSGEGNHWPFPGIDPQRILALPDRQREFLARTLSGLLDTLEEENREPPQQ